MDTITLAAVLEDANRVLPGKTVSGLVTLGPDTFALRFARKGTPDLVFRTGTPPAVYLAGPRPPSRELPALSGARLLEGASVRDVKQHKEDRIAIAELKLGAGAKRRLVLELFRRTGSIYLLDDDDAIVATIWGRRVASAKYPFPTGPTKIPLCSVTLEAVEKCFENEDRAGALREAISHISPVVAGLAAARPPKEALALLQKFAAAITQPEPVVVRVGKGWAAYPADVFDDVLAAEKFFFDDISEAVAAAAEKTANEALLSKRRSAAARKIRNNIKRLGRQLRALETELESFEDPERYRELGDLLKVNAKRIRKGAESIQVEDLFRGGETVIKLEPDLGPQENIAFYYKKHRKAKRGRAKTAERIAAVRSELERLAAEAERVETATLAELEPAPDETTKAGRSTPATRRVGRRYVSSDGYEIIVGQNARENYAVTFRISRPYDLWLHVREAHGSHVIIMRKEKDKDIPKRTVEEAAALAAYHSRSRSAAVVPVIITERRYVQRAKGGAGLVRVMREKVLFVEPGEVLEPAPEA